jgi:hypothetical protein
MRRAMRVRAVAAFFGRGPFPQLAVVWTLRNGRSDNFRLARRDHIGQWWETSHQRGWVPIESPFRTSQPLPLSPNSNPPIIDSDPPLDPEECWDEDTGDNEMWEPVAIGCDEFVLVPNPAFDGDGLRSDSYSPVYGGRAQLS